MINVYLVGLQTPGYFIMTVTFFGVCLHAHQAGLFVGLSLCELFDVFIFDVFHAAQGSAGPDIGNAGVLD